MAVDTCSALVAAATFSNKLKNQDAYRLFGRVGAASGAVIADGLGSHFGAEIASEVATGSVATHLGIVNQPTGRDFAAALCDARRALRVRTESLDTPDHVDLRNAFGTTVICGIDLPDRLIVGYVGNGAAFHVRGNFNQFPPSQLLPWSALNHLNPHSRPEAGKNALYKYLAPQASDVQITPSIVEITKDDDQYGDLLILCTDGVYSWDQTPIGRDSDGNIWISGEASLSLLFRSLDRFFASTQPDVACLEAHLVEYLAALDREHLVTDDCTLAVIVSPQAMAFQRQMSRSRQEQGNAKS